MQTINFFEPEAMSIAPPMPPLPLEPGIFQLARSPFRKPGSRRARHIEMTAAGHQVRIGLVKNRSAESA